MLPTRLFPDPVATAESLIQSFDRHAALKYVDAQIVAAAYLGLQSSLNHWSVIADLLEAGSIAGR